MQVDSKTIMQLLGIITLFGSGIYNNILGLFVGFALLVLSQASNIKQNSRDIRELKEKLNIKQEIDKLWREMDKMKSKRGAIDQTALWIIVIIILVIIYLYQQGIIRIAA